MPCLPRVGMGRGGRRGGGGGGEKNIYTAHTYQYVFTMWKKCSFEIWNRGTGNGVIAEIKTSSSSSSSPLFPPSLAPSFAVADSVARYEHVEGTVHSFIISFYIAALVTESAGGGCGLYVAVLMRRRGTFIRQWVTAL